MQNVSTELLIVIKLSLAGCSLDVLITPLFLLYLGSDEESKLSILENQSLRPTRTAKSKATQHLVCFPLNNVVLLIAII